MSHSLGRDIPSTRTQMHLILELFRTAAGPSSLPGDRVYGADEVEWCLSSGLAPMLWDRLDTLSGNVAEEQRQHIKGTALAGRVQAQQKLTAMDAIAREATVLSRPPLLLKGISTATQYYRRPYWRAMGDIDLLVAESDRSAMEDILRDLGYHPESDNSPEFYGLHHQGMPFRHPGTGVWVEVHTALQPRHHPLDRGGVLSVERMEAAVREDRLNGQPVLRLRPEFQWGYTACHWWLQFDPRTSPFGLLDCALIVLLEGPRFDWDYVLDWMGRGPGRPYAAAMLGYLGSRELIPPHGEAYHRLMPRTPAARLEAEILNRLADRFAIQGRPPGRVLTEHNVRIVRRALLQDRRAWRNLLSVPRGILFEPPEGDDDEGWRRSFRRAKDAFLPRGPERK